MVARMPAIIRADDGYMDVPMLVTCVGVDTYYDDGCGDGV